MSETVDRAKFCIFCVMRMVTTWVTGRKPLQLGYFGQKDDSDIGLTGQDFITLRKWDKFKDYQLFALELFILSDHSWP